MKKNKMITVEEALQTILASMIPVETEIIPLTRTLNRVLAIPVISQVDVPPFANSAMDGYAVIATDTQGASEQKPIKLKVIDNIPAGAVPSKKITTSTSARIMTGAPIPDGANAVIRFEETSERIKTDNLPDDGLAVYRPVSEGDNIRLAGEDIKIGQLILKPGHKLRPQDIGVLASIGQAEITVYRRPRVAILATGDELTSIDEPVTPGKIRNSNEYTQAALVEKYGGEAITLGIARDNIAELTAKIKQGLAQNVELFLTSAGVSVGDFDMVKDVLSAEGEMQFWQVAIKPGKPLAFGLLRPNQAAPVPLIGLPGNPVAAMVAFEIFARPAILKLGGHLSWEKRKRLAILDEDVTNSGRRHFMRAFFYDTEEGCHVTTKSSSVHVQGSGILTSLVWANCLAIIPEDIAHLPAGSQIELWILD